MEQNRLVRETEYKPIHCMDCGRLLDEFQQPITSINVAGAHNCRWCYKDNVMKAFTKNPKALLKARKRLFDRLNKDDVATAEALAYYKIRIADLFV